VEYLQDLFDWLLAAIAWLFVWQPGAWIKNAVQLFVAVGSAVAILYKTAQWLRGERAATRKDIRSLKDEAATKGDIENLKAELRAELRSRDAPGRPMASDLSAGLEKDLDKAVETLLAAGRADALKDKTGEAAEAALDELIAQRQAARKRVSRDEAGLYRQKGALAFLHDTEKAMRAYAKATELDPDDAEGWNQLGQLQFRIGELNAASRSFERVLALGNQIEDRGWIAIATGNLGLVYQTRGDLDQAEVMHRKSLAIDDELGSKEGMAATYGNLGLVYNTRGDLDQAEAMYRKGLAIDEELGRKEGMAKQYGNLGIIYQTRGDLDQSEAMFGKSLALDEALGRKEGMAATYGNLGIIFRKRGDLDQAEAMFSRSLAIEEAIERKEGMANQYANLGLLYEQKGDTAQACAHWRKARELCVQIGIPAEIKKYDSWLRKANCLTT
jgi:tetratricopeptide (TPR) repeat protein